ncbi:hypothetical protein [Winogradskyella flava]|uniref:Uncharacterized protein n=1 Tax=Winogradskyella flava TaxID=1884876 RepID=A0A842IST2_9FLAO|nr:hypothetical protein [Winogradskyella flava]MBC2846080.1 hypothetical protein [Winogradskyella flava]
MAQDLRNLFKEDSKEQHIKMSQGHEARFLERLDEALPKKKRPNRFFFLNIAASVVILLGLSFGAYKMLNKPTIDIPEKNVAETTEDLKTLGDVSPDLKKVEDYYLASINLELSKVQLTPENKELFDGYVQRLKELNEEYDKLTLELNDNGPNEETLDALIDNLKLRLNLVMRLKEKLQEFNDESFKEESI